MFECDKCGACCRHIDLSPLSVKLDRGDGVCRYLNGNLCSIYSSRPLICRVDECYENFYRDSMSKDDFYQLNCQQCQKLKQLDLAQNANERDF